MQRHPIYAAMIESLDDSVGRIRKKLEELGLDQNNVIIFTADKGGLSTSAGSPTQNCPHHTVTGGNFGGGVRDARKCGPLATPRPNPGMGVPYPARGPARAQFAAVSARVSLDKALTYMGL